MKKALQQKISWLTLIVMFAVSALIYVCPMPTQSHDAMHVSSSSSCEQSSGGAVFQNPENVGDCLGSHLGIAGQTQGSLTDSLNLIFLAIGLSLVASFLLTRKRLTNALNSLLVRFKHHRWRYQTEIKFLKEHQFLRYLILCGQSAIVSL